MDISSSCSLTFSQSARHDHHIMHRRPRSRPAFWQQSILIHRVMPTRFLWESYFLLRKTFIFLSISICLVCGRILTSLEKLHCLIVSVWGLHGGVELHNPDLVFVHFNCSPPTVCTSDRNPGMKIPPPIAFWVWSWRCAVVASVAVCGALCPPRRAGPRPACGRAAAAPVSSNQRPTVHHQLQCQWRAAPSTNKWDQCTLAPGLSPAAGAHQQTTKPSVQWFEYAIL